MKKVLILCLLAACFAMAAKKNVAVFPCFGNLNDKELKQLRFKIEEIGSNILSQAGDFKFMQHEALDKDIDQAAVFKSCTEGGTCLKKMTSDADADFGTWCQIDKADGKLMLFFQLFDNEENSNLYTKMFNDLRSVDDALKIIGAELPSAFKLMLPKEQPQKICEAKGSGWVWDKGECKTTEQADKEFCESKGGRKWRGGKCKSDEQIECELAEGKTWDVDVCKSKKQVECENNEGRWENGICKSRAQIEKEMTTFVPLPQQGGNYFVAKIETVPAGAALHLNGVPYQGCEKTPCTVSAYGSSIKLSASLSEYKTADTTLTITQPNQLVTIKLEPKTYTVYFESSPAAVLLNINGEKNPSCQKTPCRAEFKKGNVKVRASLDLYDAKDTTIFIGDNQRINLSLVPNYGTLNIKTKGEGWNMMLENKPSPLSDTKLLPGAYKIKLSNECYYDIDFNAEIKRGENAFFDISDKITPKKGNLALSVTYKGRSQKEPVFIDGKEAGNTPFKELIPVCTKVEFGKDRVQVDLGNLKRGDVEYTHKKPTLKSTLLSLALGAVGVVLIYNGYAAGDKQNSFEEEYWRLNSGQPWKYDELKRKAKDAHNEQDKFMISGLGLLVSAVGVYLWF
ncbi:hypothetical protein R83H12_03146 [Fibrobacteria bacterium R8-3-H12]